LAARGLSPRKIRSIVGCSLRFVGQISTEKLIPTAFFLPIASPTPTQANGLMNLAYIGGLFLAAAVLSLGVGCRRTGHHSRKGECGGY
jgi:hypothetical protein